MAKKDITSCRGTLDFLKEVDELLTIKGEVDPICEVSGVTKALDNGPALLFENIKGYPNHRILSGLFSRGERVAKIFDVPGIKELKFKGLEAIKNPIPPRVVDSGPCQEVVITEGIDVLKMIPITQHTETDPGRILGGGNVLISGPDIGNCISYKRTHFRGKDWASLTFTPGSHFEHWLLDRKTQNKKLSLTFNICPSPAVQAVASGGIVRGLIPMGTDELGIAGGIQGAPVEICRAKTVDAYAVANAEWVIEGYVDPTQRVWESDEAEEKKDFSTPFFPEFHGYQGRARQNYKFQVTAITHRKDNPIFYAPLAHSFEYPYMMCFTNYATMYEYLNRIVPGLVIDVNALQSMKGWMGLVIQVKKRRRRDEPFIKDIMIAAFGASLTTRMIVVVDEDVDIYNADEIIWAILTRVDAKQDLILLPAGTVVTGAQTEAVGPWTAITKMGFDATVPFEHKWIYAQGEYPKVDLERWLSRDEIARVRAQQSEYARIIADRRA